MAPAIEELVSQDFCCHSCENRNPGFPMKTLDLILGWIPDYAGMTIRKLLSDTFGF
jgi:hypothetical protein